LLEQHARVARVDRGHATIVSDGDAIRVPTTLPLAVGDWVRIRREIPKHRDQSHAPPAELELLPRHTELVRRAAGGAMSSQVLAANVDLALIVHGLDRPLNTRRLQRFSAIAWDGGVEPVVVLAKTDLVDDVPAEVRATERALPGVPVFALSVHDGTGVDGVLRLAAAGVTLVLVGQSGAGKSTLANLLAGEERMATGDVRRDGKGRHTTSHRELVELPGGGVLIDTPGIRGLALWDAEAGVERAFADVGALADACRFADCRHEGEPGCAVQAAIEDGSLDATRLDDHRRLQRELAALEARQDPRLRSERRKQWRAVSKAQRSHYRTSGKGR
jgi:ribosome biogenesis GTPase